MVYGCKNSNLISGDKPEGKSFIFSDRPLPECRHTSDTPPSAEENVHDSPAPGAKNLNSRGHAQFFGRAGSLFEYQAGHVF